MSPLNFFLSKLRHAVTVAVLAFLPGISAAGKYTISEVGPLGSTSLAWSINNAGEVVGWYSPSNGFSPTAFTWKNGVTKDLFINNGMGSQAFAINNKGQIAGNLVDQANGYQINQFLLTGNAVELLSNFQGQIHAVNDAGTVVGNGIISSMYSAYIQNPGASPIPINAAALLGFSGPQATSYAYSINNLGQVVGYASDSIQPARAYVFSAGQATSLGVLPGDTFSSAADINDTGVIVGYSGRNPCGSGISCNAQLHGFVFKDGLLSALGSFGGSDIMYANAINNFNSVVGMAYLGGQTGGFSPGTPTAFLWEGGSLVDLNSVDGVIGSGWRLEQARDINDSGQIVGLGYLNGQLRGFVLSPNHSVPEPTGLTLLLAALGSVVFTSRRRALEALRH